MLHTIKFDSVILLMLALTQGGRHIVGNTWGHQIKSSRSPRVDMGTSELSGKPDKMLHITFVYFSPGILV